MTVVSDLAPWLVQSRWPTVPIRYVAKLGTGHTPSRQHPEYWEDCTTPWITLADVWQLRDGTRDTITETKEKISRLGLANSAAVLHPAGTVILSRTASVGFSAIMGHDMATSQDFATWTCGPKLLPRYLLHALRAMAPDLRRVAAGSTHKTIYMPDIEQLHIPLPSMEEQQRITDFLDVKTARIDRMILLRQNQVELTGERSTAEIADIITGAAGDFGLVSMRRTVRRIEQGWSPQCEDMEAHPSEWAVLKTSAVSGGRFDAMRHKRLPADLSPNLDYVIHDGDLLMTRGSGSVNNVGVAAIADTGGRRLLLSDLLYRIHPDRGWSARFLAAVLRSAPVRGQVSLLLRGQSGQTIKLRGEDIKEIQVPAAPINVQEKVADQLTAISDESEFMKSALRRSVQLLAERKQALITAAVTGQIDVATACGGGI
ncbi:restriction endonuclease subunit S [Nonomuraea bangladeshensis]|uniref:Restriction endonuclease subunit S n=1 Tax=Nonomuraea bangladeshensis TaxID=404385 RepID=A0ABV3GYX4_9ACTN